MEIHPVLACNPGQPAFREQIERRCRLNAEGMRARLTSQIERLEDSRTVLEIKSIADAILFSAGPAMLTLLHVIYDDLAQMEQSAQVRDMRERIDALLWQLGEAS